MGEPAEARPQPTQYHLSEAWQRRLVGASEPDRVQGEQRQRSGFRFRDIRQLHGSSEGGYQPATKGSNMRTSDRYHQGSRAIAARRSEPAARPSRTRAPRKAIRALIAGGSAAVVLAGAVPALAASLARTTAGRPAAALPVAASKASTQRRQVITLNLQQRVRLTTRTDYVLSGVASPARTGSQVRIQLRTATGWRTVARVTMRRLSATRSQYRVRLHNPVRGIYRAQLVGTRTALPTASQPVPLGVTEAALAPAISAALVQEHVAEVTYANVIARLGRTSPFTNVITSEEEHIATLEQLARIYAIALPAGPFTGEAAPSTRVEACRLGVTVEQTVISLYNRLLPTVSAYANVTRAFNNLRTASQDSHLPAFQHCS